MYSQYKTRAEFNQLKFSVWIKNQTQGHALFTGNGNETFCFLEQENIEDLVVSALDHRARYSLDPVTAQQWLSWYKILSMNKYKGFASISNHKNSSLKLLQ